MLWKATFKRQKPLTREEVQQVIATDGPDTPLPGAYQQQAVKSVGTGVPRDQYASPSCVNN
jgi:hypothetical protein